MILRQAIAAALAAEGVKTVFGLMGDGNMHLIHELVAGHGVRFVNSRHETPAILMADGYARVGGGIGVATVTYGPGLAAAALGLGIAAAARAPVLLVVGDTPRGDPLHVHSFEQELFVHGLGVRVLSVRTGAGALKTLRRAFQMLRAGLGPVVLSVAVDVQDEPVADAYRPAAAEDAVRAVTVADDGAIARLAALIAGARRPILLAGRGAMAAAADIEMLGDRVNALLATTVPARGRFHGSARDLGVMGGLSEAGTRALAAEADLVVAFGASLNRFTADHGRIAPGARWALVAGGPPSGLGELPVMPLALRIEGDAGDVARRLLARLDAASGAWAEDAVRAAYVDPVAGLDIERAGGLDPRAAVRAVNAAFPLDRIEVVGVGQFGGWPAMHGKIGRGGRFVAPWEFGAIGVAVPMAVGAAAARPDLPVVAWEGDGSLLAALGELDTLGRMGARVTVMVLDDGAYGAEVRKLPPAARPLARFGRRDLAGAARALGVEAHAPTDVASLDRAVGIAARSTRASLIHVPVDPDVQQSVF